jgi:chemotaxis protein MotA
MIIVIGATVVMLCVFGGFAWGGGHMGALIHLNELLIIGGGCMGAMVIMSPRKVLVDLWKGVLDCLKGAPYGREAYDELLKMLYEVFTVARREGMIALEEHVLDPANSPLFKKYPRFIANSSNLEFLCGSLRPIIDGKIKPEQLKQLLEVELESISSENHAPVNVLTRAADAMPGFGIVAAVLGIVITMASISGPIEQIGEKVAAALVGTFLGIFLAYGFMNPLAVNLEFINSARLDYTRCIASCVTAFAGGMAPLSAVDLGRRGLSSDLRPSVDELEQMVKTVKPAVTA